MQDLGYDLPRTHIPRCWWIEKTRRGRMVYRRAKEASYALYGRLQPTPQPEDLVAQLLALLVVHQLVPVVVLERS
jgi:hypothetical protein